MKITKNITSGVVVSTDLDKIIHVIPPEQYIHISKVNNNVIHISDSAGPVSEINRITIDSSEVREAFGKPFSGDRNALIRLLSEHLNSGSNGGGLAPKAHDLADFKNGSSNTFVRKSDLVNSAGVQSIASASTFVTVDNTNPKSPKLKNAEFENADRDTEFDKVLVMNKEGVVGYVTKESSGHIKVVGMKNDKHGKLLIYFDVEGAILGLNLEKTNHILSNTEKSAKCRGNDSSPCIIFWVDEIKALMHEGTSSFVGMIVFNHDTSQNSALRVPIIIPSDYLT